MPFTIPSLTELDERIQSDFKSRIDGAKSLLRRSVLKIQARAYAGACRLLYGYLKYEKDQIFISTADTDSLDIHGNEYGVPRKDAAKSVGLGTATGTSGSPIAKGSEIVNDAGLSYFTDDSYTIGLDGTVQIAFTAEEAGEKYNDDSGISLYFVSPPSGVDSEIIVGINGIESGLDEESDDDYRPRVLTRKRRAPHGGADFDYENWALEVSGVTRAWAIAGYYGDGTVGLAFVRDNDSSIIPSASEKEKVRQYIINHNDLTTGLEVGIPVGALPGLIMVDLSEYTIPFSFKIIPNTQDAIAEVRTKLSDLLKAKGGPGKTIYLSDIDVAISSAPTETAHRLIYPTEDIGIPVNRVPVLGEVTGQDYT